MLISSQFNQFKARVSWSLLSCFYHWIWWYLGDTMNTRHFKSNYNPVILQTSASWILLSGQICWYTIIQRTKGNLTWFNKYCQSWIKLFVNAGSKIWTQWIDKENPDNRCLSHAIDGIQPFPSWCAYACLKKNWLELNSTTWRHRLV